ncbi:MAG TPA: ABC transporter permease subunit [Methylomirabilota bacterium]|jgi:iron(III) transport system permease protein|nr:ABC transporter permease subunit [Methylomirabilota bacterium]
MLSTAATAIRARWLDADKLTAAALLAGVGIPLVVFVLYPLASILGKSFETPGGFGLGNYVRYFGEPKLTQVIGNSLAVSIVATILTTVLAYGFAYPLHRARLPGAGAFRFIALLPLFAPSLVQAMGLVFLLGRNGLVNRTFGLGINVYGFWGIVIANVFYAFPHALLILSAALAVADARHYESARMLGASDWRIFRSVTLPATRYGLASAVFVVFTIVITDFGNPMVIGGDYTVLATEIYNQVSGQANFQMGTVVGMILLLPAAVAVIVEKAIARRQHASLAAQSVPLVVRPSRRRDLAWLTYVVLVSLAILTVVVTVIAASFVRLWPYRMIPTLHHYRFDVQNGITPLWTSIEASLLAAVIGVVVVIAAAWALHRFQGPVTRFLYFLSILPAAVPGMVLGLGYILAFNDPGNPVYLIYDTVLILAICNVYHYHAQGFLVATTAVKQISRTFDEASATLGAGHLRTLGHITLPIIWPAVVSVGVFFFMRSMVTLSALIFLYTPETQVAAVSVLLLDESGQLSQAAAFSTCIIAVVMVSLFVFQGLLRLAGARNVSLIR